MINFILSLGIVNSEFVINKPNSLATLESMVEAIKQEEKK